MSVAFSSDSRWLAAGSGKGAVRVWDLTALDQSAGPRAYEAEEVVAGLAFSLDQQWLAVAGGSSALLFNVNVPDAPPVVLAGHESFIESLSFSADGRWLATGSRDGTARLWDVTLSDPAASSVVLPGEADLYTYVTFGPSDWLATYGNGATRLWSVSDPAAGALVFGRKTTAKDFSADGRWLSTTSADGLQLWRLRMEELIELGCETSGRNLTPEEWRQYLGDERYEPTCELFHSSDARGPSYRGALTRQAAISRSRSRAVPAAARDRG
jgi:WD40 repeat protein